MNLLKRGKWLLATLFTSAMMWSCVADGPFIEEPGDGEDATGKPSIGIGSSRYTITVRVMTGKAGSRAQDHEDDDIKPGSRLENLIDFEGNDFLLVLFTNDGQYLHSLEAPNSQWIIGENYYEWKGRFPASINEEVLEQLQSEGFYVMALANWKSIDRGSTYDFSKSDAGYQSLNEIWNDGINHNYTYSPNGTQSWQPSTSGAAKTLIPMFGIAEASEFEYVDEDEFVSTAEIPMQRALAKIEIIDNLGKQGIHIEEAKLTSYNKTGRFITDVSKNPDWSETAYQVGVSSLPTAVNKTNTGLLFFPEDPTASNTTWIAYVPEMKLEEAKVDSKGDFDDSRTHIDVKLSGNSTGYPGGTYPVHFGKYNSEFKPTVPNESWNHLLRNHIYRFSINGVNEGILTELHLHVIPWKVDNVEEWDFTDQIGVSKTLEWKSGTFESIDENGNVYLLFDNDNDKFLTGRFTIVSPVNGRWYARLVPLEGSKTDAMTFIDANGNVAQPSTGTLMPICVEQSDIIKESATEAVIRIRPTEFGNDIESRYRLEFYVENMGKWFKVPMTGNSDYDNFTIVRRSNLIQP